MEQPTDDSTVQDVAWALRILGAEGPAHAEDILNVAQRQLSDEEHVAVLEYMRQRAGEPNE